MLKEFAVDPQVITSSFETCRYLIEKFGADKGRVISRYPGNWKRMAFDSTYRLPDGIGKQRVIEYLNGIGKEWLTLLPTDRPYDHMERSWLNNAIAAHKAQPFDAIICERDEPHNQLINADACNDAHPLFTTQVSTIVSRTPNDLAAVAQVLLKHCRTLRLIDPYFSPQDARWQRSLRAMLSLIPDITRVRCEYHIHEWDAVPGRRGRPSTQQLSQDLRRLRDVIPVGGEVRIIRWREIPGGERFHRRYLLTECAGLSYEGGLDAADGAIQTTDVGLVPRDLHSLRWAEYNLDSKTYALEGPVLVVDSSGTVTEENVLFDK